MTTEESVTAPAESGLGENTPATVYTCGSLSYNESTNSVVVGTQAIRFTKRELQVLKLLFEKQGTTVTVDMILNQLYAGADDEPEGKIVNVFICKIRKKLGLAVSGSDYIRTVWGRGYMLSDSAGSE